MNRATKKATRKELAAATRAHRGTVQAMDAMLDRRIRWAAIDVADAHIVETEYHAHVAARQDPAWHQLVTACRTAIAGARR